MLVKPGPGTSDLRVPFDNPGESSGTGIFFDGDKVLYLYLMRYDTGVLL